MRQPLWVPPEINLSWYSVLPILFGAKLAQVITGNPKTKSSNLTTQQLEAVIRGL
jgi:hypothetical protein